jgi:hypothetical protein
VAVLSRASVPRRTASAPAADATLPGLMMSGSVISRKASALVQPATATAAIASSAALRRVNPAMIAVYVRIR